MNVVILASDAGHVPEGLILAKVRSVVHGFRKIFHGRLRKQKAHESAANGQHSEHRVRKRSFLIKYSSFHH